MSGELADRRPEFHKEDDTHDRERMVPSKMPVSWMMLQRERGEDL